MEANKLAEEGPISHHWSARRIEDDVSTTPSSNNTVVDIIIIVIVITAAWMLLLLLIQGNTRKSFKVAWESKERSSVASKRCKICPIIER